MIPAVLELKKKITKSFLKSCLNLLVRISIVYTRNKHIAQFLHFHYGRVVMVVDSCWNCILMNVVLSYLCGRYNAIMIFIAMLFTRFCNIFLRVVKG